MARILILIILGWLLYQIIKRVVAIIQTPQEPEQEIKPALNPELKIVQCANCGCHVPESESTLAHDKITCNNCQDSK